MNNLAQVISVVNINGYLCISTYKPKLLYLACEKTSETNMNTVNLHIKSKTYTWTEWHQKTKKFNKSNHENARIADQITTILTA